VALLSLVVISLVVWLVLTFLSILGGIEGRWLDKLTKLHSPIRVIPTDAYYSSYYYNIDTFSLASGFETKSLREKVESEVTDPYDPEVDEQLPPHLQKEGDQDIVKELSHILENDSDLHHDFFEVAGALLKLQIKRPFQKESFLSQMVYIAPFSEKNEHLRSLLYKPEKDDVDNLLFQGENLKFDQMSIEKVRAAGAGYRLPHEIFGLGATLSVQMHMKEDGSIQALSLGGNDPLYKTAEGWLSRGRLIPFSTPLMAEKGMSFDVDKIDSEHRAFVVHGKVQEACVKGALPWQGLHVESGTMPPLDLSADGVYLPKGFKDAGVKIGDRGNIAYMSTLSREEQLYPISVAGFYDPGVIAVGAKCLFMHPEPLHDLAKTSRYAALDPEMREAIQVWTTDLKGVKAKKAELKEQLKKAGLDRYFKVKSYHDYDFSKELLEQFESDKMLLLLVGTIIMLVACSNIISFLVVLTQSKRKEIGMLKAIGATNRQIAVLFGTCGAILGAIGCVIGTLAAYLTLHNIHAVTKLLSLVLGHEAFHAAFYGESLPSQMSETAIFFLIVLTPVLSLVAAVIPAVRACRLNPSQILRSGE